MFQQNMRGFLSLQRKILICRGFILKPTKRALTAVKNGTRDFQNRSLYKRLAYISVTITKEFERVYYFNIGKKCFEKQIFFEKLECHFPLKSAMMKNAKWPYQ